MKLFFYEYIMKQEESSLIYKFFLAQKFEPRKVDWYSNIQTIGRIQNLCIRIIHKRNQDFFFQEHCQT